MTEKEQQTENKISEQSVNKEWLMQQYSDYILTKGERPINVYKFTKDLGFSEQDFYAYFSDFDVLEQEYLVHFFKESVNLVERTQDYDALSTKEKLLNFYFVFYENLNLNRSLVLMILNTDLKSKFKSFNPLKKQFQQYIETLDIAGWKLMEELPERLKEYEAKPKEGTLWMHFLSVLKFWKEDRSPGFEKTNVYIEKSIITGFEIIESPVLDKILDFGKFLWREKIK